MIRLIVKRVYHNGLNSEHRETMETHDIEDKCLEGILSGGSGGGGYEYAVVIGAEIKKTPNKINGGE